MRFALRSPQRIFLLALSNMQDMCTGMTLMMTCLAMSIYIDRQEGSFPPVGLTSGPSHIGQQGADFTSAANMDSRGTPLPDIGPSADSSHSSSVSCCCGFDAVPHLWYFISQTCLWHSIHVLSVSVAFNSCTFGVSCVVIAVCMRL